MVLPVKRGLLFSDLKMSASSSLPPSGHAVKKVSWIDEQGCLIEGVFKPLDPHYPPVLAKFSVAVGVLLRMALGEQAAEERLVFNAQSELMGTVSIYLPGFVPFLGFAEPPPADPEVHALACPSVETLLTHQVSTILVAGMLIKCDDRHPGNFGLRHDKSRGRKDALIIDYDMGFYPYTWPMKGGRPGYDGIIRTISSKTMQLIKSYLDNFPEIEERVHWPTNLLPSNFNPFKRYQARDAFILLKQSPVFHEQTAERLLVHLLMFDPITVKARLKLYLGDLPLDFLSLEPVGVQGLVDNFPDLFNDQTNKASFVEMITQLFQQEYDEQYREVVYYSGCDQNLAGCPVSSFNLFLQKNPLALERALEWARSENVQWGGEAADTLHHLDRIHVRFHQIWRDSYRPQIKILLASLRALFKELSDFEWQLIDDETQAAAPLAARACEIPEISGFSKLKYYLNELTQAFNDYLSRQDSDSSLDSGRLDAMNQVFVGRVKPLTLDVARDIETSFKLYPQWEKSFQMINQHVMSCVQQMDWRAYRFFHKTSLVRGTVVDLSLSRDWDDPAVIHEYMAVLFDWAAQPSSRPYLLRAFKGALAEYMPYSINYLANRTRDKEILPYLNRIFNRQETEEDRYTTVDGANILAYILSTDGLEGNSLNTLIMKQLLPRVLQDIKGNVGVDLQCLHEAFQKGVFDPVLYTKKASEYARTDQRFTHIYTRQAELRFNEQMYAWINGLPRAQFHALVFKALTEYEPYFNVFRLFFTSRGPLVRKYLAEQTGENASTLGLIFMEGGCKKQGTLTESSLNYSLFKIILSEMIADRKCLHPRADAQGMVAGLLDIQEAEAMKYLFSDNFQRIAQEQAAPLLRKAPPLAMHASSM